MATAMWRILKSKFIPWIRSIVYQFTGVAYGVCYSKLKQVTWLVDTTVVHLRGLFLACHHLRVEGACPCHYRCFVLGRCY